MLHPVAEASTILEGKNYPTSNLVLVYVYGAIATLAPGAATMQHWDSQLLEEADLQEHVEEARSDLYVALQSRWIDDIPFDEWALNGIAALCYVIPALPLSTFPCLPRRCASELTSCS